MALKGAGHCPVLSKKPQPTEAVGELAAWGLLLQQRGGLLPGGRPAFLRERHQLPAGVGVRKAGWHFHEEGCTRPRAPT